MVRVLSKPAGKSKTIEFTFPSPPAREVLLLGSFTQWERGPVAMKKDRLGVWRAGIKLPSGQHEYRFLVDGTWQNDPACRQCVPNSFGSANCVVDVR
ncbi:MAG: glycoside hydrolase [Candidatus Omnitrophica bacterium]|nr:glycoside hydrolase [Candidatus Omnitrophota bacterium]